MHFLFFDKKRFRIIDSNNNNINVDINSETNANKNSSLNNKEGESLVFQKDHDKYMNLYNNFMKKKSSTIETNAQNYLNYLLHLNKPFNVNNDNNDIKKANIPSLSPTNSSTILKNFKNTVSISNEHISRNNLTLGKKNTTEINLLSPRASTNNYNNTISSEKSNFIANNVKTKNSDITNPFFL